MLYNQSADSKINIKMDRFKNQRFSKSKEVQKLRTKADKHSSSFVFAQETENRYGLSNQANID